MKFKIRHTITRWFLSGVLVMFVCLIFSFRHAFHTSIAEVRYNAKADTYEVSLRVFTDDLETALAAANHLKEVNSSDPNSNVLVGTYARKHFAWVKDKDALILNFVGKEQELDATWIYLELPNASKAKGYNLLNNFFMELFDDQSNIVNIFYNSEKRTLLYDQKTKLLKFPF